MAFSHIIHIVQQYFISASADTSYAKHTSYLRQQILHAKCPALAEQLQYTLLGH